MTTVLNLLYYNKISPGHKTVQPFTGSGPSIAMHMSLARSQSQGSCMTPDPPRRTFPPPKKVPLPSKKLLYETLNFTSRGPRPINSPPLVTGLAVRPCMTPQMADSLPHQVKTLYCPGHIQESDKCYTHITVTNDKGVCSYWRTYSTESLLCSCIQAVFENPSRRKSSMIAQDSPVVFILKKENNGSQRG